jgi:ABC-2 type transport system ATP-binding protein
MPNSTSPPAISFENVKKTYRGGEVKALNGVSFDIPCGEFFGLLGPNGAGKTTLISVLAGLARATEGRVRVMGHDVVDDYAAARKALGVVPQELVFDPFFSVRESLRIQSGYFGVKHNDDWIDELLANRLNKEGHTVLLTTHYLEEAEALCQRIGMLKGGRLVALDRTSQLLAGTAHTMLRFKTDVALPAEVAARARVTGRIVQVTAHDATEVETTLATLRAAGVPVEDLEIGRADLEDVFLNIMQGEAA